ncbi:MBL fold metallo-hydrolase [Rugamonas sp. A1-17]|nr:MBL fold metallo-hydrolase [Rugamonas sp. A1-17]
MPNTKPARKGRVPAAAAAARLRIRLYRHGLGDCFLLRFGRPDHGTFNILIDCGLISVASDAKVKMQAVVADIAAACGNRIDAVVMTHEHWDHASGFSTQQAQAQFDQIDVGEAWYAWTENPQNPLGARLRAERAKKVEALAAAAAALGAEGNSPLALARAAALESTLQFFGTAASGATPAIGKTRAAFDYLSNRNGVKNRYLEPGTSPLTLDALPGVRIYVLGPPQNEALIKKSAPTKSGREVYEMAAEADLADNVRAAFVRMSKDDTARDGLADCPFDVQWHRAPASTAEDRMTSPLLAELMEQTWDQPGEAWRKIDDDWTSVAETLALNLDTHTNNTCLVLAFELIDSGEVFLFPADAQVGNWLSWQDLQWTVRDGGQSSQVSATDLLRRTVFYKVGHHGSHNATLRALGLEQMQSDELVAYIPVIRAEAEKNRWMGMPFGPLVDRLREKTRGRLLQSDDNSLPEDAALADLTPEAKAAFRQATTLASDKLYVEISYA